MGKCYQFFFIFVLLIAPVYSQWNQTGGPGTSPVNVLYKYQGILFAGTQSDGVYKSTDNGSNWIPAHAGIEKTSVNAVASNSNYLFVSVTSTSSQVQGVYRSSDMGTTWTEINNGLANTFVSSLLAVDSYVYAGTIGSGVWRSTDNGDSWTPANAGMEFELISSVAVSNNNIYAAASNFLFVSADQGVNWSQVPELSYFTLRSLKADSNFIFVGVFGGLKRSSDYGQTWSELIEIPFIPMLSYIQSYCFDGSVLYGGINAYPGIGFGVIKSTDQGLTWTPSNAGIEERSISSLLFSSAKLFAGSVSGGIFSSTDEGGSWNRDNAGLPAGGMIRSFLSYSNYIFAGTQFDGIYGSTDHGATWESMDNDVSGLLKFALVFSFAQKDNAIYAGTSQKGIFKSTDLGAGWFNVNNGLPTSNLYAFSIVAAGNNLIVGTSQGIYYSTDDGDSWTVSNVTEGDVQELAAGSGYQYAVVTTGISLNDGIFRSSNNGVSWNLIYSTSGTYPASLAATGSYVYLGDSFGGIVHSTDNGNGFSAPSLPGIGVFSIYPDGQKLFVGTSQESNNIYMSDLDATNWQGVNEGLPAGTAVNALVADSVYLFAGTENIAVWSRLLSEVPVELTAFSASVNGDVVNLNWKTASETNNSGFEIQRTEVRGQRSDWKKIGFVEGIGTTTESHSYSFTDKNVVPGKYSYRLKQIDFDGSFTYSKETEVQIDHPAGFSLSQNYPNPFNPATNIEFAIPEKQFVSLKVYDILGKEVATLVNEEKQAGYYSVEFDGSNLASGLYFYKMQAGSGQGFVQVRKMVMLK